MYNEMHRKIGRIMLRFIHFFQQQQQTNNGNINQNYESICIL